MPEASKEKIVLFAFNGNPMCLVHVFLNALDLNSRGQEVRIVFEGMSVSLIREMEETRNALYRKVRSAGLIDGICRACSMKAGVLEYNEKTGLPLLDDMNGHPSFASYLERGYRLITL